MKIAIVIAAMHTIGSSGLFSQDLEIEYDHQTKATNYFSVDDKGNKTRIGRATVGRDHRIIVRVLNLNQQLFTVNSTGSGRSITIPSGGVDLADLLKKVRTPQSGGTPGPGIDSNTTPTGGDLADMLDDIRGLLGGEKSKVNANVLSERRVSTRLTDTDRKAIEHLVGQVGALELQYQKTRQAFLAAVETPLVGLVNLKKSLRAIALQPEAGAAGVRGNATNEVLGVMSLGSDSPSDLPAALNRYGARTVADVGEKFTEMSTAYWALKKGYEMMDAISTRYPHAPILLVGDEGTLSAILLTKWIQTPGMAQLNVDYQYDTELFDSLKEKLPPYCQEAAQIYLAVMNIPFESQYSLMADNDIIDVEIKIESLGTKDDKDVVVPVTVPQTQKLSVPVSGGWKVNGSAGFGLSWFGQNNRTYFTKADTIRSADRKFPFASAVTMLHGYPQSGGYITGGPSIGVGVSLDDQTAWTLMLGGSLILGRDQRFVFTGGFVAGQAETMNPSFSEGEFVKDAANVKLTTPVLGYGAFFGVSYNILAQ